MNADPNDFDALKKLLALKRHEQPPPGYFDRLPQQIRNRIETEPATFWEKYLPTFNFRPAYAYGFGFVVCGSLIWGIGYSLQTQPNRIAAQPADGMLKLAGPSTALPATATAFKPLEPSDLGNTNGTNLPKRSLFDGLPVNSTVPASYQGN